MTLKVVQLSRIGNVTFSRNRRSKNIKISVKADKTVLVSYPFFVSTREVAAFVEKNETWIKHQQQKFDSQKSNIEEGMVIPTKQHSIHIKSGEKMKIEKAGKQVTLFLKDFSSPDSKLFTEQVVTQVYRYEAKTILPPRITELADKYGFQFNKVTIRDNRRNWGSCSSKNNISLNLQMMKLPDELIDYILLHELVHTKIKNHGEEFWKMLNLITGNRARGMAKQVKKFSTYAI